MRCLDCKATIAPKAACYGTKGGPYCPACAAKTDCPTCGDSEKPCACDRADRVSVCAEYVRVGDLIVITKNEAWLVTGIADYAGPIPFLKGGRIAVCHGKHKLTLAPGEVVEVLRAREARS